MKKAYLIFLFGVVIISVGVVLFAVGVKNNLSLDKNLMVSKIFQVNEGGPEQELHPLAIESLRQREYPGSNLVLEQVLKIGSNYGRYIVSYKSDGLKIFGLLTIPNGEQPEEGWPAIIFNHGYIPPNQYVTTQRYEDYVNGFAKSGYVVFKPDYRGHGNSEGEATGNYFSPGYTVDVANAVSSIKRLKNLSTGPSTTSHSTVSSDRTGSGSIVNADRIGMWGHSMGGNITMRNLVISDDIKAAVIWAGVVGSYEDILNNWSRARQWSQSAEYRHQTPNRQNFLEEFGAYEENLEFWNSIDPYTFLEDVQAPIQLHHGTGDEHVPLAFSEGFKKALEQKSKSVELYTYDGADHNLTGAAFDQAMARSIAFFDKYLK